MRQKTERQQDALERTFKDIRPDVDFGRGQTILLKRESIKRKTIEQRSLQHRKAAA